jgi:hypothetical protein
MQHASVFRVDAVDCDMCRCLTEVASDILLDFTGTSSLATTLGLVAKGRER